MVSLFSTSAVTCSLLHCPWFTVHLTYISVLLFTSLQFHCVCDAVTTYITCRKENVNAELPFNYLIYYHYFDKCQICNHIQCQICTHILKLLCILANRYLYDTSSKLIWEMIVLHQLRNLWIDWFISEQNFETIKLKKT